MTKMHVNEKNLSYILEFFDIMEIRKSDTIKQAKYCHFCHFLAVAYCWLLWA